jgi:ribulose-5-phosphate 4-epimerase/fuculose-1-phosphate aldolase
MAHAFTPDAALRATGNRPDLDGPEVQKAREDMAACFRMAARNGFEEGIDNHFSALVPGHDDLFIVNPHGYAFREITASMLLICDMAGNVVSGRGAPEATAFFIHAQIHQRLPRARVAFHTHMPYATALTMSDEEPLIFAGQSALKFYGRTAYDREYNGLAFDASEGARIADACGDADIIFMKHHGVMVLAPTIGEAWDDLYFLERAAQVQCIAQATGRRVDPVAPEIAAASVAQMRACDPEAGRMHLVAIRRTLDAEEPEYTA